MIDAQYIYFSPSYGNVRSNKVTGGVSTIMDRLEATCLWILPFLRIM